MSSSDINCYNPGDDLGDLTCIPKKCAKKTTYEPTCMYNTQGQFICDTQEPKINTELGVEYILDHPKNKITVSATIS